MPTNTRQDPCLYLPSQLGLLSGYTCQGIAPAWCLLPPHSGPQEGSQQGCGT